MLKFASLSVFFFSMNASASEYICAFKVIKSGVELGTLSHTQSIGATAGYSVASFEFTDAETARLMKVELSGVVENSGAKDTSSVSANIVLRESTEEYDLMRIRNLAYISGTGNLSLNKLSNEYTVSGSCSFTD